MSIDHSILKDIEANLASLEIYDIRERLRPLLKGYRVHASIFDPGAFVYRGRKFGENFTKALGVKRNDLIFPLTHLTKLGRLNRDGQPIFYASLHKNSVVFELRDLKENDEFVLSFWKTTQKMLLSNIGYTETAFKRLGAKRSPPQWQARQVGAATPDIGRETITLPNLPTGLHPVPKTPS